MSIGAHEYESVKRLDKSASDHGMKVVAGIWNDNVLSLIPADDKLPIYSRDAVLATGTVNDLLSILRGWDAAREYYLFLGLVTDAKVAKKEDEYNQKRTLEKLKTGNDLERIEK